MVDEIKKVNLLLLLHLLLDLLLNVRNLLLLLNLLLDLFCC
jgi:hypothetical protein